MQDAVVGTGETVMSETKIPVLGGYVLGGGLGGGGDPPDEISILYVRQKGRAWRKEQASSPRAAGQCRDPGCPESSPLAGQQLPTRAAVGGQAHRQARGCQGQERQAGPSPLLLPRQARKWR